MHCLYEWFLNHNSCKYSSYQLLLQWCYDTGITYHVKPLSVTLVIFATSSAGDCCQITCAPHHSNSGCVHHLVCWWSLPVSLVHLTSHTHKTCCPMLVTLARSFPPCQSILMMLLPCCSSPKETNPSHQRDPSRPHSQDSLLNPRLIMKNWSPRIL